MTSYRDFLGVKLHLPHDGGFEPIEVPGFLFPFQRHLVEWAIRRGRAAIFADYGLGKSITELTWADNVSRHSGRPVLILTPLAVAPQMVREAAKFGLDAEQSRDGSFGGRIVVTNYEKLHHFRPDDFAGVVCDESSILKNFGGATRKRITRFVSGIPYRLLCTATPSPNDYVELGTTAEALGELTHSDMLRRFFQQLDDKGQRRELGKQEQAEVILSHDPSYYRKLAFRVSQTIGQWRLKHHAVEHFWRWVASWSRACRMPSDLGFDDGPFVLPPLIVNDHLVVPSSPPEGFLFTMPAFGMHEERLERRRTLAERCDRVAGLVDHGRPAVVWCHTNDEGDRLSEVIPDAEQVAGVTPEDRKIALYEAFTGGTLRVLVIKPKIGAWGLNWQHCSDIVMFATHSYEQYHQAISRCRRYGQERRVRLDVVATEGEVRVLENMRAKARRAEAMFSALVRATAEATRIGRVDLYTNRAEIPSWL